MTQNQNVSIIGKWYGVRKEAKNGRSTLRNGAMIEEVAIYEFKPNGVLIDYTNKGQQPIRLTYSIKNDILQLGRLTFKIEKLDKNSLVIIDYDPLDPDNLLVFRHYFKR